MIEIMIDLQGGAKAPLYEKIYEYIKRDVIEGKIPVGDFRRQDFWQSICR